MSIGGREGEDEKLYRSGRFRGPPSEDDIGSARESVGTAGCKAVALVLSRVVRVGAPSKVDSPGKSEKLLACALAGSWGAAKDSREGGGEG